MAKSIMQSEPRPFFTRVRAWWQSLRAPVDPIGEILAKRVRMVQCGEYEPLGSILMLQTDAGWIQFPSRNGPALARFADGQVDLLDPWEWDGLPDRYETTSEMCPDCEMVPCNECHPKDADGGEVHTPSGELIYRGERICSYGTQVECCGGAGVIACQDNKVCPSCGGSGKVKCRRCQGTAFMRTGFQFGAVNLDTDGKFICPTCGGSGWRRDVIPQRLQDYLNPTQTLFPDDKIFLGPITAIMLSGIDKRTQPWKTSTDTDGAWPHIASSFQAGARALIVGGVLRPEARPRRRTND